MTGIEKIIAHIQAESEAAAKIVTDAAEAEVQEMLAAAEQKAKLLAANENELNEAKLNEENTAAQSAARLAKRRVLLSKRGELIAQVIADAQKQLEELPDGEAVAFLLKLAAQCAGKAEGEMQLCEKDLARLPADFAEQLKKAAPEAKLTISKTPVPISGGFILRCGEIEQNCSLESLFYAAREKLQDIAQKTLFCA